MSRTKEISEETYQKIKDQLLKDEDVDITGLDDLIGKCFFFRTVTYHLVGKVTARIVAAGRDLPASTRDGVEVTIRANMELPQEVANAVRFGARGIGLYRSEFLFLARTPEFPSEEDHYRTYRELAEKVAPHPAVIRTLDFGGEKYFHAVLGSADTNPVLGLRAVRFCLQRPDIFRPQVRALLRAAAHAEVWIMIPLVTAAAEVREVRRILAAEAESLKLEGLPCRRATPLGIMIATPRLLLVICFIGFHGGSPPF